MSSLIVEVCAVEEIAEHQNADRLERVRVKNWWCIAPKNHYKVGDKVVYLPPDSVIPEQLAEDWGIAKYCAPLAKGPDGIRPPRLRIRASRFRGEPSFGCIQDLDDQTWPIGYDVKEYFDITKWEPPLKSTDGDAAPPDRAFPAYTDIENIGNFPEIFEEGEEVIVTEKIHGTNCRVGVVPYPNEETGEKAFVFMAGSHAIRRREVNAKGADSRYWFPLQDENLKKLLRGSFVAFDEKPVIVYCEIFGRGVQDMQYGQTSLSYRVFDVLVDGRYLDAHEKMELFSQYSIPAVPILYRGSFSMEKMNELVDGPTTVCDASDIKGFQGREGIVITPVVERFNMDLGGSGRVILKYVSVDYHERRNQNPTENH